VQTLLNKFLASSGKREFDFGQGRRKLAMHICLVLDECSAPGVDTFFHHDNVSKVQELIALLESKLADSVTLVVAGTGALGSTYDSKQEAYFYRMKHWGQEDVRRVLEHFHAKRQDGKETIDTLVLQAQESPGTLVAAISAHPWLAALTTNGRAAFFLCESIAKLSQHLAGRKESWYGVLGEWTPTLVEQVVHQYTSSNGIKSVDQSNLPRVAAFAFDALASATDTAMPDLTHLDLDDYRAVTLLLQSNIIVVNGKSRLLGAETFALTVTPAIAVVLFNMAGITARMMTSWKSEEQVAALFAARRWILDRLFDYRHQQLSKSEFEERLGELRLFRLQKPIQLNKDDTYIPMVSRNHVLLNGDKASCADVIAPYMLLQCTHSVDSNKKIVVDLAEELGKCGLLRGSDDRLLRGLVAVWQGTFDSGRTDPPGRPLLGATGRAALQRSSAFPENLLTYRDVVDPVRYATVGRKGSTGLFCGGETIPLPTIPDDATITFVLVTNVRAISVKLPPLATTEDTSIDHPTETPAADPPPDATAGDANLSQPGKVVLLDVSPRDLTVDMQVNQRALTDYIAANVRKNVVVKVLFTNVFENSN
jgi:hypothetical protein